MATSTSKLSLDLMDAQAAEAAKELANIGDASSVEISRWWKRWYGKTGHKRLGRLIMAQAPPETQTNAVPKKRLRSALVDAVTVHDGFEFRIRARALDTTRFVVAQYSGSVVSIDLNTNHPIHEYISVAATSSNGGSEDAAGVEKARMGIQLLLQGWATYELGEPAGPRLERAKIAAADWGRATRRLLRD